MASGITNFAANLILEKYLRATANTFPPTLFVALMTATPTDDTGSGTELTSGAVGGYARKSIVVGSGAFAVLSLGSTSNSAIIDYGTASSGAGTAVNGFAVYDTLATVNQHLWGALTTAQTIASGNPYSFAIGALVIAMI